MKKEVIIIAEAGVNHNGSVEIAKELAKEAKAAGANFIKYQTFITEEAISTCAKKAEYQISKANDAQTQRDMVKLLELKFEEFIEIECFCKKIGINFLSTPFDLPSIEFLKKIDMQFWKIPSGEITNIPYLIKIAETGKPILLSTGMSTLEEVEGAVELLKENGAGKISILHCNTEYPTPYEDINLRVLETIRNKFNCQIGYSDHSNGIEVSIAAVALGAMIIEKHFTLDKNMEGPDHKASLEPQELKKMVDSIRNIERALGDSCKTPTASEIKNMEVVRKSIVAKNSITAGEVFTEKNITTKRPGTGISPIAWFDILGQRAKRDFKEDELIEI